MGGLLVAALRTVRRLTGGSRGFSEYMALGPTFWDVAESHRWKFSCFFGGLGLSGLRILLSYFWPAPLQRPKGKKSPQFFFRPPMGPNLRQTTFYRNRN